jgi:hypothetical protein
MQFFGGPHDGREVEDKSVEGLSEVHFKVSPGAKVNGDTWYHAYVLSKDGKRFDYKGQVKAS